MLIILAAFLFAAVSCGVGLVVLTRILPPDFLAAQMTARSNHSIAARQIGGLIVVPVIITTLLVFSDDLGLDTPFLFCLVTAMIGLWIIGWLDDRYELSETIRLAVQLVAACLVAYGLGGNFRLLPDLLPAPLEPVLVVVVLMVAINVTNFMDGLDLMTVVGTGIPLAGIALVCALGLAGLASGGMGAAAAGALTGFAFHNRPPARVFLGDSGSLPLGLVAGTALLVLARETSIIIALLIPLYYILDAGTTVLLRLFEGENILKAHSKHAYQVAKRAGWSVMKVVLHVAVLNIMLVACAVAALLFNHPMSLAAFLLIGTVATLLLLLDFRGRIRKL